MRLLRPVLLALLALALVPLSATPSQAVSLATISGTALDASGKPLPVINWEIYEYVDGEWRTLPFGPKLTDAKGRFSYRPPAGKAYRVCFHDRFYDRADNTPTGYWQPEIRHRDTCWPNATTVGAAQSWTPAANASKQFTVTMPKQGLGMAPVEPFIVGTFEIGKPLTVVGQEGWRPTTAAFSYRWMVQGGGKRAAAIPGATKATFTPTSAQAGLWIWAEVTASRAGYKPATLASPTTQVGTARVQLASPLKITGTAKPGATLTASFGKPTNSYSEISWFVDGVPQPNHTAYDAASSRFPVAAAHAGARIDARMKIYQTNTAGYIDGTDSFHRVQVQVAGSRPVQALPTAPKPKGTATVGRILTAPSNVTADPNASVRYQWMRGASSIKGATGVRYKVRAADVNKLVRVRVTVARPGWWNRYVTTSTATVAKRALKKGTVKIAGTSKVGRKLTAKTAKWGPKPVRVRYQWLRNGRAIKGATKATYRVRKADRRKVLRVRVVVKKPKYLTVVTTSKGRKIKR